MFNLRFAHRNRIVVNGLLEQKQKSVIRNILHIHGKPKYFLALWINKHPVIRTTEYIVYMWAYIDLFNSVRILIPSQIMDPSTTCTNNIWTTKTRIALNKFNNDQDEEQTCWLHIKAIYTNHHLRRTCRYEVWDVIKCHKEPLTHALFDEIRLGLDYMNLWIVTSSSHHVVLL